MKKSKKPVRTKAKLPHNSRFFSAKIFYWSMSLMLWAAIITGIGLNWSARYRTWASDDSLVNQALLHPDAYEPHVELAKIYWLIGVKSRARQEIEIAQSLFASRVFPPAAGSKRVLGVTTSPMESFHSWQSEPQNLQAQLAYWQSVVKDKPDYLDAYLTIAAVSYRLGDMQNAKDALEKSLALDPNNSHAQLLRRVITESVK
jgi:tetratricopeptide (TPR) repeat protein